MHTQPIEAPAASEIVDIEEEKRLRAIVLDVATRLEDALKTNTPLPTRELRALHRAIFASTVATVQTNEEVKAALAAGRAVWEIMDITGDLKHTWDPRSATDVEHMRRMFEDLTKTRKYRAYNVTDEHKPGEPMETFDASAGRVIFRPQMQGG